MTDWNVATGAEQPINRTGAPGIQVVGDEVQGTLVGTANPSGASEQGLYAADASATADVDGDGTNDGPLPALGVLLPERVVDETALDTTHPLYDQTEQLTMENRTLKGDRGVFLQYGVEMINDADDTSFTPGEPVYLDEGGGFTQDTSAFADGSIVQQVGIALPPNEDAGIGTVQGDRILLAVEDNYEWVSEGDATFSGDGAITQFDIPHGLPVTPSVYEVEATSADAAGDYYVTAGGTNLTVTFASAPASGTDNVTFNWSAEE